MSKSYFGKPSFLMAVISGTLWAAGVALLGLVIKSLEQVLDAFSKTVRAVSMVKTA